MRQRRTKSILQSAGCVGMRRAASASAAVAMDRVSNSVKLAWSCALQLRIDVMILEQRRSELAADAASDLATEALGDQQTSPAASTRLPVAFSREGVHLQMVACLRPPRSIVLRVDSSSAAPTRDGWRIGGAAWSRV